MKQAALVEIRLLQKPKLLHLSFDSGEHFELPCLYLRENSPSAEMRQQSNNRVFNSDINVIGVEPIGNYAIKLIFDDGHDTGIFTWEYLYELGTRFRP